MGSKGSQTVTQSGTQSQNYTPNQPIKAAGEQAVTGAQSAAQLPFQMPQAPVAPFTPFQNQAFQSVQNLQGFAQPYFNTAGAYLAGSAAPITGADVANYYNPMAANVTAQMQNIFGQQNVQNTGNLVQSAGGVGADRVAVGQANMANQQGLAAGQTYAGLYQQALAAAEQNKQMQAGAGYAFGQMGPAAQAAQFNAVNQLLGAGGQQQQLAQAQANAAYQQQLAQIAFPYQQPQYLAGITAGLAPAMGGTTNGQYQNQTTYPSPSPIAQALGVGTAALGLGMGIPGFGSAGTAFMGGAPWSAASQYMPGGSAYGATPMAVNGGYYPMFGYGGPVRGYDDGGEVQGDTYGKLADRGYYEAEAPMLAAAGRGNPLAETITKDVGGIYNFDDGGAAPVIKVGDVVPLDPFGANESLQSAFDRLDNRKTLGASGLRAANPLAVDRARESGVLKIFPSPKGMDDGGGLDQPSPMQLNLSPISGFDAPGANPHVGASGVIPKTQLPTGQGGKSGLYGQYMFMPGAGAMGQHSPQQSNPMQMGQLGNMLGKDIGQLGNLIGGSGAGAAGADAAGTAGDVASYASDIMDLTVARGGRLADGGSIDDNPTIGPGNVPMAPAPQVPMPRPHPAGAYKGSPTQYWDFLGAGGHRREEAHVGAAGGRVGVPNRHWDYLQPMQPQTFAPGGDVNDDTVDIPGVGVAPGQQPFGTDAPSDVSTLGMLGRGAKQVGQYVADKWNTMMAPGAPPVVPPEAQSHYPSEGHPNLQDTDRPFENVPSEDESLAYDTPMRRSGSAEMLSDPLATGRDPAAGIRRIGSEVLTPGHEETLPSDPFGHGMQAQPGAQGALGVPGAPGQRGLGQEYDLDYDRLRRTTKSMETWQENSGDKRGDPYRNISPSYNSKGQYQEALGAYGIMLKNLPEWSRATFGRVISKEEFLAHPEIQDAIHDKYMGDLVHKYGINGAGRAWLGGEGALNAPMRTDPYGTRVGDYGNRFAANYDRNIGAGVAQGLHGTEGLRQSTNVEYSPGMYPGRQGQGPMGSSPQVPFPGAANPNSFARRFSGSIGAGLVDAGARMAQTHGPIGSVIGAGLGQFGQSMRGERQELDNEELINQKAQALHMAAEQHLRAYAQKDQEIAETKRWHDTVANLRGTGQFASTLAKVQANPMYAGLTEEQQEVEAAKILSQGSALAPGAPQGAPQRPAGVPDNYVYGKKDGKLGWGDPAVMDKS